ncbi:hypothetical protein ACJRO7_006159 [Eucalyptus globulus]|uniref:Leucine-rich repeat-containing N-terminal plant-type domain-containing protein n=1 Tax=Eucalyptus globulus TaxID=34317 RepID=A0ABD3IGZ0_EUCGL
MAAQDSVKVLVLVSLLLILDNAYVCLCRNGNSSSICFEEERNALLQLRQSLSDPSHVLSSWNGEDCCRWIGLTCNRANGHVVKLQITSVNENPFLTAGESWVDEYKDVSFPRVFSTAGELTPSLLNLRYLSYLDLSGIFFEHAYMPKFIGSMKQLRYLDLSHSFDFAIVPHEWGNLTELEVLDLHGYYRTGAVDDFQWLSHLQALKYVDMSGIHVNKSGDLMQVISALPSLSHLSLSNCGLYNFHPGFDCLANSTALHLEYLDLSDNSLRGPIPSIPFQNMTSLEYLDLSVNSLGGGPIPSIPFQNMTSLRYLYLSLNSFNSSVPRWFNNLRSLVNLNLANNLLQSIEGGLFSFLREQLFLESLSLDANELHEEIFLVERSSSGLIGKNFKRLRISNNFLQGTLPDWLFHLKNLTVLDLSYNQLHGTIPSPYDWLCLRVLCLSGNQLTRNIPDAFGRLQFLSILDLSNNLLNGTIPQSLGQLQYLLSLDLSANSLRGTISKIHFSNLSKLWALDISNNHLAIKVDSDWIPPFNLQYMGMVSCKFGTEFPRWIRTQAGLTSLHLSNASILGSLPDWLGLMSLSHLNLSHNQINGSLSEFPSSLHELDYEFDLSHNQIYSLNLSHNQIYSLKPSHNQITDLEFPYSLYLDLSHNQINSFDLSPSQINESSEIFYNLYLDLSHNQINLLDLSCNFGSLSEVPPFLSLDLSHNQINSLDLSHNQINGSLLKFPFYQLDLSHNLISGPIPKDIGLAMPHSRTLNLNDNLLSGPIPTSICEMEHLYDLHLGRNELVGEIPTCWKESPKSIFDISSNKLSGVIPSSLGNLIGLTSLHLNNNRLQGGIPMTIKYCRDLRILDLGENKISGSVPHWIGPHFPLLQILRLRENIIDEGNPLSPPANTPTDYTQEHVEQVVKGVDLDYTTLDLKLMVNLDLSSNKLVGPILGELTLLSGLLLESLDLSNNHLSGTIPQSFSAFMSLTGAPRAPKEVANEEGKLEKVMFYIVIMLGFVTGFWAVVGSLEYKKNWRRAYFNFVDRKADMVYVIVAVKAAELRRRLRRV